MSRTWMVMILVSLMAISCAGWESDFEEKGTPDPNAPESFVQGEEPECVIAADCKNDAGACEQVLCVAGECKTGPVFPGTACEDAGLALDDCTVGTCQVDGDALKCKAAPAPNGHPCELASWEPPHIVKTCQSGACVQAAECLTDADCADQEDGDLCNGIVRCIAQLCVVAPGSAVTCEDTDQDDCAVPQCNPATGYCEPTDAPDDTPCDDGDDCTGSDVCTAGACAGPVVMCELDCDNDIDDDNDGDTDCQDDECADAPNCQGPYCGDDNCDEGETCENCEEDCGACPVCGDEECNGDETCETCEDDCGACPFCGDGTCDEGEGCETCVDDCACGDPAICVLDACVETACEEGEIEDCNGACASLDYLGDDTCDDGDFWPEDFACEELGWDGGDCEPCYPDCGENVCGDDGCGGSCGECGEGEACFMGACQETTCEAGQIENCNGECSNADWIGDDYCDGVFDCEELGWDGGDCEPCYPDCGENVCGDDGCGGSCGECGEGLVCNEGTCEEPPTCTPADTIECDDVIESTTVGGADLFDVYECNSWDETGPEMVYEFTPTVNDVVSITIEDGDADLDLFILTDTCTVAGCVDAGSMDIVDFEVTADTTYYIVVDGYQGDEGAFTLTLACQSTCETDCEGKTCGDDGCGGSCGDCGVDNVCVLGNCEATECVEDGYIEDCDDVCKNASWVGDDYCDSAFNCEEFGWDGGDCPYCGDGECGDEETCETCVDDCGECVEVQLGTVIITEFIKNPDEVNDDVGEWIELYNTTDASIDVTDWTLTDDGIDSVTLSGGNLEILPMGYIVVGLNADTNTNGGVTIDSTYTGADFILSNGADEIHLRDTNGDLQDSVVYTDDTYPDPKGASVQLDPAKLTAADNDDGTNWCAAANPWDTDTDLGTPGEANENCQ